MKIWWRFSSISLQASLASFPGFSLDLLVDVLENKISIKGVKFVLLKTTININQFMDATKSKL